MDKKVNRTADFITFVGLFLAYFTHALIISRKIYQGGNNAPLQLGFNAIEFELKYL